jgi:hypothetical protein
MRKILIIIIIGVIVVLTIGGLVYFLSNRTTSPSAKPTNLPSGGQISTNQLKVLSKEPVFDYWIASSTQEIIYINKDGKIGRIGQDKFISEQTIKDLDYAQISPDGQNILVAFGDPHQPQFSILNLITDSWSPLPLEIKSATWSPEGKRLAAVINQNEQNNLVILDLAKYLSNDPKQKGKSFTIIVKNFSLQDLKMDWLTPDEIFFTDKPSGLVEGSAWRLNFAKPTNTTFTEIIPPGNSLMIKWLKDDLGIKFQNQQSSLINWAGQTINNFSVMVLPNKCVSKSDSFYCFLFIDTIPRTSKINWPDDYFQKTIYTRDGLYKFDPKNLTEPQLVFDQWGEKNIDATNIKTVGNQILFINRYDNQLYSLEISQ